SQGECGRRQPCDKCERDHRGFSLASSKMLSSRAQTPWRRRVVLTLALDGSHRGDSLAAAILQGLPFHFSRSWHGLAVSRLYAGSRRRALCGGVSPCALARAAVTGRYQQRPDMTLASMIGFLFIGTGCRAGCVLDY